MSLAPERLTIGLRRLFTSPGVDPYDELVWERRDARITNWKDGAVAFEQRDVEFPVTWSVNATNIVSQKYFRGTLGTPERESSLRQVVDRVVDTITTWGHEGGYFADADEEAAFRDELAYILVTQRAAFNSPVWFNIGVPGVPAQASACFILSVDDTMDSILNWYREEGIIFKGGSGIGDQPVQDPLQPGAAAGRRHGVRTGQLHARRRRLGRHDQVRRQDPARRQDGHPRRRPPRRRGVHLVQGEGGAARRGCCATTGSTWTSTARDSFSIQYQNANNSVRVTDEFMQAVAEDADWGLVAVKTGEVMRTIKARDLWRQIAQAAWECADPGLQFDTTINRWHTAATTGRINGSNPCFTGDTLVHTDKGLIRFKELFDRANHGEEFQVWTHDLTNPDEPRSEMVLTTPEAFMITGATRSCGCGSATAWSCAARQGTASSRPTAGYVEASELTADDDVRSLDLPAPGRQRRVDDPGLADDVDAYRGKGEGDARVAAARDVVRRARPLPRLAHRRRIDERRRPRRRSTARRRIATRCCRATRSSSSGSTATGRSRSASRPTARPSCVWLAGRSSAGSRRSAWRRSPVSTSTCRGRSSRRRPRSSRRSSAASSTPTAAP